jgi:class 3 adenylate cyclase
VLPAGVITTVGEGYCLACRIEDVDAGRFELLVAQARRKSSESRGSTAVESLVEALGLWRGRALIDLVDQPMGMAEAARLEELRQGAEEDLIDARLGLGEHQAVVAEAQAAVAAEPLRERRWAQLMTALYRCGRQADALRAYRQLREHLSEELGIEPSRELVALEEAVLLQKSELAWTPRHDDRFQQRREAPADTTASDAGVEAARPVLPSGVLTFVLTDVVGSTTLWDSHPRDMVGVLDHHDELITKAVTAHSGVVLKAKGEGDSTMSVFARASDALAAAVELQERFDTTVWPEDLALRVRVAVHTGETYERDGDYFGPTLNRAARLRALARGGQVLTSSVTAALVRDLPMSAVVLWELGHHQLPGLSRPERVFEVTPSGLQP